MATTTPGSVSTSSVTTPASTHPLLHIPVNLSAELSSILPVVLSMLQAIREGKEELLLAKEATKVNEKFQKCLKLLEDLPGTDLTREQQEKRFIECEAKLKRKCELIEKYQTLPIFQQQQKELIEEDVMQL